MELCLHFCAPTCVYLDESAVRLSDPTGDVCLTIQTIATNQSENGVFIEISKANLRQIHESKQHVKALYSFCCIFIKFQMQYTKYFSL